MSEQPKITAEAKSGRLLPEALGSAIQRTCWNTGAVTRMCNCGGPQIPVITDGRSEWANCPICGKSWDIKTLMELPNVKVSEAADET